ncbi:hypothetical protein [Paraliomyxa miuraensis]|uniref:hypothetical protein n=1 Tax=Paraliomyxa miuraensis TaxID=376150 RepID=UPI002254496B|nr:hypothetical protein [Paraliomyxa miuraensis]MCX4246617.1 hypothetical protein [Paraliomyxa miuraensis]
MIHLYAVDPRLVAGWAQGGEHRLIHGSFGLGTPRALLEIRAFPKWKREVHRDMQARGLTELQQKRADELIALFAEQRYFRPDALTYDGTRPWLENAVQEHMRQPYRGILATANPRRHPAVLDSREIDPFDPRWRCESRISIPRTAEAIADALGSMVSSCPSLHLVDPHFGPENRRHRDVLVALCQRLHHGAVVYVHCGVAKENPVTPSLSFFEEHASKMARLLPSTVTVRFVRLKAKPGGDRLHNRYAMTPLGGIMLGIGLDTGKEGETDDLVALSRDQYLRRWKQYADNDGTFEIVDTPAAIRGRRRP